MERIPQSVTKRLVLKAYLSTDHVSAATGKTIAVTISKNGGAFGNPSAGATNATEIANGWYYVDLSTTDTGTTGPLIVRGTATGVDDVERIFVSVDPHNAGFDGVPAVTAGANGGLPTGNASGQVTVADVTSAGADAILDRAAGVETGWTLRQALRIMLSALGGKADGAATTTMHFRDQADSKNRITATVDANGNRTAVTLDAS